jgi:CBS domain-containing protein
MGLNVGTDWRELQPLVESFDPDFVLVMAAEAGRSGGTFDFKTLEKIHKLRDLFPDLRVHVDGGIDDLAAASLRGLGVQLLVSGSYIHSGSEASERLAFLRGVPDNPSLLSLLRDITPSVPFDASWDEVLDALEIGGVGCTAVLDSNGLYLGIITDYDIRVCISENGLSAQVKAEEICNKNSFTALPDEDFWTFMIRMQGSKRMHTVIPLVTTDRRLLGIVRTQDVLFRNPRFGEKNAHL